MELILADDGGVNLGEFKLPRNESGQALPLFHGGLWVPSYDITEQRTQRHHDLLLERDQSPTT
jgi:hypothetical protein